MGAVAGGAGRAEVAGGDARVLLRMPEVVEGGLGLLEVLEVSEVLEVIATPYAGGCETGLGWVSKLRTLMLVEFGVPRQP